jgi:hypothetical protein
MGDVFGVGADESFTTGRVAGKNGVGWTIKSQGFTLG